ncbi:unnamed protein product [Mesocestoides corti]|uniref:Homeobox domain-containing protein n=2 Tax=Mesocestoides corti TaxID=53468 RepID=A0A0R3U3P1_MESCO|nr:unnamed protein product [Mesocestoides corti]
MDVSPDFHRRNWHLEASAPDQELKPLLLSPKPPIEVSQASSYKSHARDRLSYGDGSLLEDTGQFSTSSSSGSGEHPSGMVLSSPEGTFPNQFTTWEDPTCPPGCSFEVGPPHPGLPVHVSSTKLPAMTGCQLPPLQQSPSALSGWPPCLPCAQAALHHRQTLQPLQSEPGLRNYHVERPLMREGTEGIGGAPSRRKNVTRESTSILKAWLQGHIQNPYPTKGEKIMLAIITKMTLTQVSTWFANARRRLKKENRMTWMPCTRPENIKQTSTPPTLEDTQAREEGESEKSKLNINQGVHRRGREGATFESQTSPQSSWDSLNSLWQRPRHDDTPDGGQIRQPSESQQHCRPQHHPPHPQFPAWSWPSVPLPQLLSHHPEESPYPPPYHTSAEGSQTYSGGGYEGGVQSATRSPSARSQLYHLPALRTPGEEFVVKEDPGERNHSLTDIHSPNLLEGHNDQGNQDMKSNCIL